MKKMMFIAVLMSVMLMPAQMMAKNNNRDKARARVENRVNNKRKDFKVAAKKDKKDKKLAKARPVKHNDKKFKNNRPPRRPKAMAKMRRPAPRPRPIPRPRPVPCHVYHNHCCDNDAVEAAATIVGIATLAAILAD